MRVQQVFFKKKSDFNAKEVEKIKSIDPQLIMLFGGVEYFTQPEELKKIQDQFPKATVVGCTTAGEISNKGVFNKSLVATGIHFNYPKFKVATSPLNGAESSGAVGKSIGQTLKAPDLKAIFLMTQGVGIDGAELLKAINSEVGPSVMVTGGLAGDEAQFKQTFTYHNGKVSSSDVIAVGFYGDKLTVNCGSEGGFVPYGAVRKVTKAKGNILYELDHKPAWEIYKEYLGTLSKNPEDPAVRLMYPFAVLDKKESPSGLIRSIVGVNEKDKSLVFGGDVEEGWFMRLMQCEHKKMVEGASHAVKTEPADNNGLGLLVSCIGRKLVMGDNVDDEVEAVHDKLGDGTVITGFYSYGEFGPQEGFMKCQVHNQTMTVTYLNERE